LDEIPGELAHLASRIENGKSQLSLQTCKNSEIAKLPVPMPDTTELFREEFGNASRERDEQTQRLQEARAARDKAEQQIDKLEREMDVPTEEVLSETRQHREGGWRLIKRWWLEGECDEQSLSKFSGGPTNQQSLAYVYEQSVASSDETGDRLRREAQRVGQKASLLAQRAEIDRQIQDLEDKLAQSAAKSDE